MFFLFLCFSVCLGISTLTLQLCAQCSDPGIVLPLGAEIDPRYVTAALDLDEAEQAVYDEDPIY